MKELEEKWIKLEEEFALQYHAEHKHTPTYAEAIEWTTKKMIERVEKYMKENTHPDFVFFGNNGWRLRDKFIDDLKSFLEE